VRAQRPREGEAIAARQQHVEDGEVRGAVQDRLRLARVGERGDRIAVLGECAHDGLAHGFLVLDDDHPGRRGAHGRQYPAANLKPR
jgi:hypothetical protein